VPIESKGQILGVMSLVSRRADHFTSDHATLLTCMGRQIGIAIENARLYEAIRQELTDREQAEQEIEQRTAQLEILLNEVNHRVKNNLTIIMGILSLEMKRAQAQSDPIQTILRDLQERIRGLATVHDLLHDTRWAPLPLAELADQVIRAALSGSPIRRWIDVQVTPPAEPLSITPQQATGLGLVINELTTNSLKHAFIGRDHGRIELQIASQNDPEPIVSLRYRDDGPGWPKDVMRGEREGVGLHIIRMTVRSPVRGQLMLDNDGGAVAHITFKRAPTEPDTRKTSGRPIQR
jgi:two-component sensor histidine kinase